MRAINYFAFSVTLAFLVVNIFPIVSSSPDTEYTPREKEAIKQVMHTVPQESLVQIFHQDFSSSETSLENWFTPIIKSWTST